MPAHAHVLGAAVRRQPLPRQAAATQRRTPRRLSASASSGPPPSSGSSPLPRRDTPNWVFHAPAVSLSVPAQPLDAPMPTPLPEGSSPLPDAGGLARLRPTEATAIVMGAALGLGAPLPSPDRNPSVPLPFSASPRRTRGVAFTCNACGERTVRRINPVALETGTTFVQCSNEACLVYHKLVDNLGLFHELKGPVYSSAPRAADAPLAGGFDALDLDLRDGGDDAQSWLS